MLKLRKNLKFEEDNEKRGLFRSSFKEVFWTYRSGPWNYVLTITAHTAISLIEIKKLKMYNLRIKNVNVWSPSGGSFISFGHFYNSCPGNRETLIKL